jgi:aminoglycoside 6'-N-acetyltransferase
MRTDVPSRRERAGTLKTHDITLRIGRIMLRPLIERDWDILLRWNSDPEVLYFSEGTDVSSWTLEEVKSIYCTVSQEAYCFIIEFDGKPVGECWLQKMNLPRILARHAGFDCRRIDLMIGEKTYWHRGIGTKTVRLLAEFGFEREKADMVFACDVADYNVASLDMFRNCGFEINASHPQPLGGKAKTCYDLVLRRAKFFAVSNGVGGKS